MTWDILAHISLFENKWMYVYEFIPYYKSKDNCIPFLTLQGPQGPPGSIGSVGGVGEKVRDAVIDS